MPDRTAEYRIIEKLIFRQFQNNNRFTQDSPVYPDVWMEYFNNIEELDTYRADLILSPHRQSTAPDLLKILFEKQAALQGKQKQNLIRV